MARAAGWLQPTSRIYQRDGSTWVQDWRIRPWHPSFLPELWRMLDVRPSWAKPLMIPAFWAYVIWKMRSASDRI